MSSTLPLLPIANLTIVCRLAWLLAILICLGVGVVTSEGVFAAFFRKDTNTRFKNIQATSLQVSGYLRYIKKFELANV